MSFNLRVKGNILTKVGGSTRVYAKEGVEINSKSSINYFAPEYTYGEPEDAPKRPPLESESKFESIYLHAHLLETAKDIMPKFNSDDTSIIYRFYKALYDGEIANPLFLVSSNLISAKPFYSKEEKKIIIWETSLLNIEKSDDKKIQLLFDLAICYGDYLNDSLKDLNTSDNFETYEYDLFRFDAIGTEIITFAKIETPFYKGNLELSFPENEKNDTNKRDSWKPEKDKKAHGPNAGDGDFHDEGPGDPPAKNPNIGLQFSYSLQGGFTASLYAGISKNIKMGDFGIMPAFNAALTLYTKGAPGTSSMSPILFTLTGTPSFTLGYKTGNALPMNLFNQASGSGVWNPYEYGFTLGTTGILSSGAVSRELNVETGDFGKNPYNSHDINREKHKDTPLGNSNKQDHTRNQIVGGAAIKVGNFMIASYNDIYKPPLFFGMGSDQYWSAGINMQAKFPKDIKLAYAVDMYYGKSNNKSPYNVDKVFDGQNYDYQQLFDVLLNRGQETFTLTDAEGNINTQTKYGYGTFWPTNMMHDSIPFPEGDKMKTKKAGKESDEVDLEPIAKEPQYKVHWKPIAKEPQKPEISNYKNEQDYENAKIEYEQNLDKYNNDKINYEVSLRLKAKPTFHHLYVLYDFNNKVVQERLKKFLYAGQSEEGKLLKEFYLIEQKNKL